MLSTFSAGSGHEHEHEFQAEVLRHLEELAQKMDDMERQVERCHQSLCAKMMQASQHNAQCCVSATGTGTGGHANSRRISTYSRKFSKGSSQHEDVSGFDRTPPRSRSKTDDLTEVVELSASFKPNSGSFDVSIVPRPREDSGENSRTGIIGVPSSNVAWEAMSKRRSSKLHLDSDRSMDPWDVSSTDEEDVSYKFQSFGTRAWNFLENPNSSLGASVYDKIQPFVLLVTVTFTLSQTVDALLISEDACRALEIFVDLLFFVEIALRWLVSPIRGLDFFSRSFQRH